MVASTSPSPRDTNGHMGLHVASTAAGSVVKNAGFYDADILAALEDAISDGVNVISMSIGTFAAVKKGITVSCSAGNDGPRESTVENLAPWILTVGASSIDRDFRADAILGDGSVYSGVSLILGNHWDPLICLFVYSKNHGHRLCVSTLKPSVKGPGGPADPHLLPATMVDPMAGNIIRSYANQSSAKARIILKERVTPGILKPDFMAPGVNILASWTGVNSPSGLSFDTRRQVKFNIKYDNTGNGIRDLATGNPSTPFDHGSDMLIRTEHLTRFSLRSWRQ
ncbi:hypothetical protein IFM89_037191 [Coptis chinensis]|uniref:Peptidase S8/S53 domain-containing protein n=1 Tax=Coptis chinensis TaxID=261450 RepID=A0A835HSJ5_9MAGN|nr:hypothetical protein IFM89_037191 [Coptis chinensis]